MATDKRAPMDRVIVTAAITGSRITREATAHIPITLEEIANSAVEAVGAGASMVHIHVRDPKTGLGAQDLSLFKRVMDDVLSRCDVIINLTTSGIPGRNLPPEDRMAPLDLKPEMASFDAGSMNLGGQLFANPPDLLELMARRMQERGVKPELEIFDVGMIYNCLALAEKGVLQKPFHFQFVLGAPGGSPGTVKSLLHMLEQIPPDSTWSIAGIGRAQLPLSMVTLALGGHIRTGLEDNLYYSRGVLAKSNAELVERVVRIVRAYGKEIAAPAEARELLGLRKRN